MSEAVKRLIVLAAGRGERMGELTKNTPKPLVQVHGIPIVKPLLDAAVAAGIPELILVRGYLGEQFDSLLKEYPTLRLVDNTDYDQANNLGSVMAVRQYLSNAYIAEGDLLLYRPELLRREEENSNYLARYAEYTDDWCFRVEEGSRNIQSIQVGGKNCYHMYGISYWSEEDGKRLARRVEDAYNGEQGKTMYWDEVALKYYKEEFNVQVRPCQEKDIVEIDTYEEWKALEMQEENRI